jgi:hypothetical protein
LNRAGVAFIKPIYMRKLEKRERVWFVSSHGCGSCGLGEEQSILQHLQMVGKRLASFDSEGASVYLYALKDRRQGPALMQQR